MSVTPTTTEPFGPEDDRDATPSKSTTGPCLPVENAVLPVRPTDAASSRHWVKSRDPVPVGARTLWHGQSVRVPTRLFVTSAQAVMHVAALVANLIREKQQAGQPCVLGLPTGSTPVGIYRELIRLHRDENLDFSNVITFNLDEYYPIQPQAVQSFRRFMYENFFDHVNIPSENIHLLDGQLPREEMEAQAEAYEQAIRRAGGLDLCLIGVGRNGHIAFNEPGSTLQTRTRIVRLDPITRQDAGDAFYGEDHVPTQAITMGVATILDARKIILLAFGEHKAKPVQQALELPLSENTPASFLQQHPNATFVIDSAAAEELTFSKTPWLIGPVPWTEELICKAVLWLSFTSKKALLKLTAADFRQYNLHELLREHGPVQQLIQQIFNNRMQTICYEPGGATPQRIICFSPHPDDDVISMGGTLIRLREQQHEVHIAYMTSGNVAVHDRDAIRFANFVADFNKMFGIESERTLQLESEIHEFLAQKKPGQIDHPKVLTIKGLVRKIEAIAGAAEVGIAESFCHFLDLPFYRTGRSRKKPLCDEDVQIILKLLRELRPGQIYVAGDLADPHGTHRICAEAIFLALEEYLPEAPQLEVWLYRGAWQEWEPHQIERAVPLSPTDLERKKNAIFRHESQNHGAMFPGTTDNREFWQRAEERNRNTAKLYDLLGLPEFYAIEGFVLWKPGKPL